MTKVTIKLKVKPTNVQQGPFASMRDASMDFKGDTAKIKRDYDPGFQRIQFRIFGDLTTTCDYEVFDTDVSVRKGTLKITEGDSATKVIRFKMTARP